MSFDENTWFWYFLNVFKNFIYKLLKLLKARKTQHSLWELFGNHSLLGFVAFVQLKIVNFSETMFFNKIKKNWIFSLHKLWLHF